MCFSPYLYRARNLVERFFNKIKQCRRIATATTNSLLTTSPSSSWQLSASGDALTSPHPNVIPSFKITLDNFRSVQLCQAIWSCGHYIGATFSTDYLGDHRL
jgi:hypothetical protein